MSGARQKAPLSDLLPAIETFKVVANGVRVTGRGRHDMQHVYIENSPENARCNLKRFAADAGLDFVSTALLTLCVTDAWLDGHAEVAIESFAAATGLSTASVVAALDELSLRDFVDCANSDGGKLVVRPTVLASQEGSIAGIGWWQRFALDESGGVQE